MKYIIHLIGATAWSIEVAVSGVEYKPNRTHQLATLTLEGGTEIELPVYVPALTDGDKTLGIHIWTLNNKLAELGVIDPDTRIAACKDEPGPVLRYSNTLVKATSLTTKKADLGDDSDDSDDLPADGTLVEDPSDEVNEEEEATMA